MSDHHDAPGEHAARGEHAGSGKHATPGEDATPGKHAGPGKHAPPGEVPEALLALIREAVAAHSPTYHEAPAVGVFERAATSLGLRVRRVPVEEGRDNLVVEAGPQPPTVALVGHMDTIEGGGPAQAQAYVRDGTLYGLGTADMKAACMAMLYAASRVAPEVEGADRRSPGVEADGDGAAGDGHSPAAPRDTPRANGDGADGDGAAAQPGTPAGDGHSAGAPRETPRANGDGGDGDGAAAQPGTPAGDGHSPAAPRDTPRADRDSSAAPAPGGPAPGGFAIHLVVGEEEYGDGAAVAVEELSAPLVVVGEPTGMRVCLDHYNYYEAILRTTGSRVHAALPELGANAISAMLEWISAIHSENRRTVPLITNLRRIEGGSEQFLVPERCEAYVDIHTHADISETQVEQALDSAARTAHSASPECSFSHTREFYSAGFSQRPEDPRFAPVFRALAGIGHDQAPAAFRSHSDAPRFFDHGIATVVCGPGNLAFAHTADEHIALSQVAEGVQFYTELLRVACGVRERRG